MNDLQKKVLIGGAILLVIAMVYVPWVNVQRGPNGHTRILHMQYGLVFSPPIGYDEVRWPSVGIAMLVVAILTGAAYLAFSRPTAKTPSESVRAGWPATSQEKELEL
jgi:hypothetical protein